MNPYWGAPYWGTELDILELGFNDKAPYYSDEPSAIEHRLARATGGSYGRPPLHWQWKRPIITQSHQKG